MDVLFLTDNGNKELYFSNSEVHFRKLCTSFRKHFRLCQFFKERTVKNESICY